MNYYSFNQYLREKFNTKVRKIGLNTKFDCPNKNGDISSEGCIFCNETGFSEFAESKLTLEQQLEAAMQAIRGRRAQKFIAYFQNGTNTNASLKKLKKAYDIVRKYDDIVGLSISTRPDCVDEEKLDLIADYTRDYDVWVEYGVQTVDNRRLKMLNRGLTFDDSVKAIKRTAEKGIKVGVHMILGLPGERKSDIIKTAEILSELPIHGVKFHALHVLRDTDLVKAFEKGKIKLLEKREYIEKICDFIEHLRFDCVILRLVSDAKREVLVAPKWMGNKLDIIRKIDKEFARRGTKQGIYHQRHL